jgi:1-acyl-sn-glycerol-3-phosphate acyltransferase
VEGSTSGQATSAPATSGQQRALAVGRSVPGRFVYGTARRLIRGVLYRYFRLRHHGADHLALQGPLIIAPVHRSNLDAPLVAALSTRRTKSLAKVSLFSNPAVGWVMAALGGFPVERGTADREAIDAATALLRAGEAVIVFPEGTRQTGPKIAELFDGATFLSARTGAPIVPVAIAGTEAAMPPGARRPRRSRVAIVVGEPIAPPVGGGARLTLRQRRAATAALGETLQTLLDEAQATSELPL